jgi:hypothetical protein
MKRIVLALFLIWATPAAAQPQPVDWRKLVDAVELDRIENWERHFAEAVRRADRPDMRFIYGIDRAGLADLARTTGFNWPAAPIDVMAACRIVETVSYYVGIGDRHACRLRLGTNGGRLTKLTGATRFDVRLFPDSALGAVVIGEWWTDAETGPRRRRGPDRRYVGVLRARDGKTLHLFLASRTEEYDIPIVDLNWRWPRQGR